jgi:hypothetical protein
MTRPFIHNCVAPIQPRLWTCKNVPCTGPTQVQFYAGQVLGNSLAQYKFIWDVALVQVLQEQELSYRLKKEYEHVLQEQDHFYRDNGIGTSST